MISFMIIEHGLHIVIIAIHSYHQVGIYSWLFTMVSNEPLAELEKNLAEQMQEYEDLTRKYELLEEDYVVIKAQMVMEKEQIEGYDSIVYFYLHADRKYIPYSHYVTQLKIITLFTID